MVTVAVALPPAARVGALGEIWQLTFDSVVQLRFTAPLNPFTDARLMTSVALPGPPMTLMGRMVESGTSVKSKTGFELEVVITNADGL